MQSSSKPLALSLVSVGLGIVGYQLLRVVPYGVNWLISITLLVAALLALSGRYNPSTRERAQTRWFALPAIIFAGCLAVRDAVPLLLWNMFICLFCMGVISAYTHTGAPVTRAFAVPALVQLIYTGIITCLGPISTAATTNWQQVAQQTRRFGAARSVLIGLVLALPLLVIFGALFSAADANFERLLRDLFDLKEFVQSAAGSLFIGWLVYGLIGHALNTSSPIPITNLTNGTASGGWNGWIGSTELITVLALLNALFAVFVAMQFRYLFSALPVGNNPNLNEFADYARRGFIELIVVAGLALMVLLLVDWVVRKQDARGLALLRGLGMILSLLVFIIIASALHRMVRYAQAFGLTNLRVYTTAFMLWIAVVFAWLMATVLRGKRQNFAIGATIAGFFVLFALNVMNVDDFIVRTNIGFAHERPATASQLYTGFDAHHAALLSADAYPALLEVMDSLPDTDRCHIANALLKNQARLSNADWRTWNMSRSTAQGLLQTNEAWLKSVACNLD